MPLPGVYDLALYRGDTYQWRFRLWSDLARTVPVDLTGATAKAEIRDRSGGTMITPMTVAITLPNVIDLTLSQWTTMPPDCGVWDLQVTFPDGDVHTAVRGAATIASDVTDSPVVVRRRAR